MSRVHRTREQWRALIAEFEQSDLSQKDFCEPRGINPAYFSQRRLELQRDLQDSNEAFALAVPQSINSTQTLQLRGWPDRAGYCHCPVSPRWVAQLVKELGAMKMFVEPPAIYLHKAPVDFRKKHQWSECHC